MLNDKEAKELEPKIKIMQIIIGALPAGALFMFVLMFIMREAPKFTQDFGLIPKIGIGFGLMSFVASFVVPMVVNKQAVKELAKEVNPEKSGETNLPLQAIMKLQNTLIIRCALIEGATFCNILFYFVTGSLFSFGVATLGLFLLISNFPFPNKVFSFIDWLIDSAKDEARLQN